MSRISRNDYRRHFQPHTFYEFRTNKLYRCVMCKSKLTKKDFMHLFFDLLNVCYTINCIFFTCVSSDFSSLLLIRFKSEWMKSGVNNKELYCYFDWLCSSRRIPIVQIVLNTSRDEMLSKISKSKWNRMSLWWFRRSSNQLRWINALSLPLTRGVN